MGFAPVSDGFDTHPKVLRLARNVAPLGLWIVALTYSTRYQLDGAVPSWYPRKVAGRHGERWAEALVRVGLWDVTADGWVFHNYLDWQRSRIEIEDIRHKRQWAGYLGGKASAKARSEANASSDASSKSKHVPKDASKQRSKRKVLAEPNTETETETETEVGLLPNLPPVGTLTNSEEVAHATGSESDRNGPPASKADTLSVYRDYCARTGLPLP